MTDEYLMQSEFSEKVFITDSALFGGDKDSRQRTENIRAAAKKLGEKILSKGHKLYILSDHRLGEEIESALKRTIRLSPYLSEDVRCILAVGGGQTAEKGKAMASTMGIPLFIWCTAPDSDTYLSPFFVQKVNGMPAVEECREAEAAVVDLAAPLEDTDVKRGVGLVAKALLALPETSSGELTDIIKECFFVDFSKLTPQRKLILYSALFKISLKKTRDNGYLLTSADNLAEILSLKKGNKADFAYPCARMLTEIYSEVCENSECFALPPDQIKLNEIIKRRKFREPRRRTETGYPVKCPDISAVRETYRALALFEDFCSDKLPFTKTELREALILAAAVSDKGTLNDLYCTGVFG